MSLNNEEEFRIKLRDKQYLININILGDQLFLMLTLLIQPKKQYSGFFSLNELRISSKIFHHTSSLFEAKEIIKRTIIKKHLSIYEDDHKAKIIFDTGLGTDSIPFPIILFRDLNVNYLSMSLNFSNHININQNNIYNSMNINNNQNLIKNSRNRNINKGLINSFSQNILKKPSIGNNLNNKMINNNNDNIEISSNEETIKQDDIFNKTYRNFSSKSNIIEKIIFNNKRSKKIIIKKNNEKEKKSSYHEIDLDKNINYNNNHEDYFSHNNNILYKIYHNMRNNNIINSSFYKNLQNSFISNNLNSPNQNNKNDNDNNNLINNNTNLREYHNNNLHKSFSQQNISIGNNNGHNNINNHYIHNINQNTPQNNYLNIYNPNKIKRIYILTPKNNINDYFNKNKALKYHQNQYLKTSPNKNNYFQNSNNIIVKNNRHIFTENCPKDNPRNKINSIKEIIINKQNSENEISKITDVNFDKNIEEENLIEKKYRFRNLLLSSKGKIKGNLEKFKKSQNLGDYIPTGQKFVSYLKFPDTRSIISSNNVSTLSTSIASSSNRIPGIEKNIIKYPSELEEITFRIKRILNKKNIKFKKIYKGTNDGDSSTAFHKKCDNIKNTLILIYASCNKRFGGFTTQTWDGDNINKIDNNSFIFSIDKMKVYDVIKDKNAIKCNPDQGPIFINQIKIFDNYFTQGGMTCTKGNNFMTMEDYELTGGAEKFGIKEIEVYYAL